MRSALAERERAVPAPERERRALEVVRRPAGRRRLGLRQRPGLLLVGFAVCLALLAVGRVTLSFAVVQKNLQTETLVRQQRALEADNVRLQEQIARLAATPRVRMLAIERHGLVPAQGVIYLDGGIAGDAGGATSGSPISGRASAGDDSLAGAAAQPGAEAGSGDP